MDSVTFGYLGMYSRSEKRSSIFYFSKRRDVDVLRMRWRQNQGSSNDARVAELAPHHQKPTLKPKAEVWRSTLKGFRERLNFHP